MRTDRKLLEAAAKAAGYEFTGFWHDENTGLLVWEPALDDFESRPWNPLTDDGDALRLAVKLKFEIRPGVFEITVCSSGVWQEVPTENYSDGEATRRAIVLAAAAMAAK